MGVGGGENLRGQGSDRAGGGRGLDQDGGAEGREMLFNIVGEKHQKTFQNKRRCGSYILAWITVIRSVKLLSVVTC